MENVFQETMDENFPDLRKETDIQVQKAQSKMGPKRYTPKHIIVTMTKGKQGALRAAREKQRVTYKRTPIRLSTDVSAVTLQAGKGDIFKVLKGGKLQCQVCYLPWLSLRIERERTAFQTNKNSKRS